jgi:hypothetical protein
MSRWELVAGVVTGFESQQIHKKHTEVTCVPEVQVDEVLISEIVVRG